MKRREFLGMLSVVPIFPWFKFNVSKQPIEYDTSHTLILITGETDCYFNGFCMDKFEIRDNKNETVVLKQVSKIDILNTDSSGYVPCTVDDDCAVCSWYLRKHNRYGLIKIWFKKEA